MTDNKKHYWLDAALKLPGDDGEDETPEPYQLRILIPHNPEIGDFHEYLYIDGRSTCDVLGRGITTLQALGYDHALYVYDDEWYAHFANVYLYSPEKPRVRIVWRNINARRKELVG